MNSNFSPIAMDGRSSDSSETSPRTNRCARQPTASRHIDIEFGMPLDRQIRIGGDCSPLPDWEDVEHADALRKADGENIMRRSEEHTSELQSLMRISYAVFCLKKKKKNNTTHRQS